MFEILTFFIVLWLIRALRRRSSKAPEMHFHVWHHWPDKGPGEREPIVLTEQQLRELCYRALREPDPELQHANNVVPFRPRLGDDR